MKLSIIFYFIFHFSFCNSELLVFKESDNTDLSNIITYFQEIDNVVVLRPDFSVDEFNNLLITYNFTGFILPGGASNISDFNSQYWLYTNLTMISGKPKIGICLGFQHIMKYLTNVRLAKCFMYRKVINYEYHNHKWCIKRNTFDESIFDTVSYTRFEGFDYLNKIVYDNIYALSFHPEKNFEEIIRDINLKRLLYIKSSIIKNEIRNIFD